MKTKFGKKFILLIVSLIVCCCLTLTGCGTSGSPSGGGFVNNGDSLGGGGTGTVPTEVDVSESESAASSAAVSDLGDLASNVDYTGATALSADGTITAAGNYILSGEYPDGITIATTKKDQTVHLFLNGATVSNAAGSGIIKSEKKVNHIITVIDGTTNSVASSAGANAVHVKGTLSINGSGTLNVTAGGADASAIKVSKSCTIVDATVNVSSAKHGISAETIVGKDCSITVSSADKDGLHAECDFDNSDGETYEFSQDVGYVSLTNVNYDCSVNGDGIQADTFVYIDGGHYNVTTNGEFVSYSAENLATYGLEADDFRYIKSGSTYKKIASDENGSLNNRYALVQSTKGIKVGEIEYDTDGDDKDDATVSGDTNYAILIESGTFTINSTDDAVHCNSGNTLINGGTLTIDTYDDGVTSDLMTKISGGTLTVRSSYEGIEGAYVTISGGTIDVTSSDDGINAASDDNSISEYIVISGGDVTVNASGDGLDSNGSILISGGNAVVHGPTSGGDGALDADSGIIVTGGTLYAASTLGMVETPSQNSTQCVISYAQNSAISGGSVISVKDEAGNVILSVTATKSCQSIIFSSSAFQSGKTYYIFVDDEQSASATISGILTFVGSAGNQGGNQHGGPNGNGGNRPIGDFGGRR